MTTPSFILSIETATPVCSVSISKDGAPFVCIESPEPNTHASGLTVLIQKAIEQAEITFSDLSAVSVSMGPGSYTGLRIGVSAAKGLCYALDIPLIGINSLEAMTAGYQAKSTLDTSLVLLCPMIDARRQEVYTAFFDLEKNQQEETQALIVDEQSFDDYLEKGYEVYFFGSGADKFEVLFADKPNVHIVPKFETSATYQDKLAYEKFQKQEFEDVAYFEPFYLKDFVATKSKKNLLS